MSDEESDEEESSSNGYTRTSDNVCIFVLKLCNEREKLINIYYDVAGWVLCVISHIREGVFKNSNGKHHIQVNDVIKTFYDVSYEKEFNETIDTFWIEYI